MIVSRFTAAVDLLAPVSLDELNDRAALQTRTDRKYVVSPDQLDAAIAGIGHNARALEVAGSRLFEYESVYFDTPTLESYFLALRKRPDRFKVRSRCYVSSGTCMLEVKLRDRHDRTVKHRMARPLDRHHLLHGDDREFLVGFAPVRERVAALRPTLITSYWRSTLLVGVHSRATVDFAVTATSVDGHSRQLQGVVVETKSVGRPSEFDRSLWAVRARPVAISKFATGMAVHRPDLPANKWRPVLARYSWG